MAGEIEVKVCPVMTCSSVLLFPEISPTLPCGKHGIIMVDWSDRPLRKVIYQFIKSRLFRLKYATHKITKPNKDTL